MENRKGIEYPGVAVIGALLGLVFNFSVVLSAFNDILDKIPHKDALTYGPLGDFYLPLAFLALYSIEILVMKRLYLVMRDKGRLFPAWFFAGFGASAGLPILWLALFLLFPVLYSIFGFVVCSLSSHC